MRDGPGFFGGSLWLEGVVLTLDLAKGEGGLCPEAERNTYLLLCLLTEMPRVEKEWPESWKQWNKVLQNVENSICQVQTGVRERAQPCHFSMLYCWSLLLPLTGVKVEIKICGNWGTFYWSRCNLTVREKSKNFNDEAKDFRNFPYKTNLFIKKNKLQ